MSGQPIPHSPPADSQPHRPEVQIFFAQATETGCRVIGVWDEAAAAEPQAFLYGPESPYATTLRARFPLARRPGAADKPAEAWIAEPCFWTPAAPYVYRYEVRFPPPAPAVMGMFGIRRMGVQGDHLVFDRKHWVLRGAVAKPIDPEQALSLAEWHDAPLTAMVDNPADQLCEQASRLGVLLVARVSGVDDIQGELRRLSRWPAVGIAILPADSKHDDLRCHARNVLFAQAVSQAAAIKPAAWSQVLFCEVGDAADFARKVAGCPLPVVAVRPDSSWSAPAEARAACDRLQRDLASEGLQFAGYLV